MILTAIIVILLALVYYRYVYQPRVYWKNRNFPSATPVPIFGNFLGTSLQLQSFTDTFLNLYRNSNENCEGVHFFTTPILLIKDLELIRAITIKHFDHFVNHSKLFLNLESEPALHKNLFNIEDDDWRRMRATLSPAFTGSKMRTMFPLVQECADDLSNYFKKLIKSSTSGTAEVHAKNFCGRFTNDVIATTAFGIRVNSLEEQDNTFYLMGKRAAQLVFWKLALNNMFGPHVLKRFNFNLLDKEATDYLINVFKQALKARREQEVVRQDMVDLLLEAQKASVEQVKTDHNLKVLTDEDLLAQTFLFFFGGYDTVSTQLSFAILELALNPDVQQRLYEEITNAIDGDRLTYEKIMGIKYLEWVIHESQRKWPPAPILDRLCTKDFEFDDNGTKRVIKKGDLVWLSASGNHMNPRIYKNPDVFEPERFNEENSKGRHPCATLGFGSGPRFCIGNRFAMLSMKVMLANCVKTFEFVPTKNTQIPIGVCPKTATLIPNNDIVGVRVRG